jgi:hypothetical protein
MVVNYPSLCASPDTLEPAPIAITLPAINAVSNLCTHLLDESKCLKDSTTRSNAAPNAPRFSTGKLSITSAGPKPARYLELINLTMSR